MRMMACSSSEDSVSMKKFHHEEGIGQLHGEQSNISFSPAKHPGRWHKI